jgi:lipoprotein-anchoring transpeptidase ErfK/SrfK
MRRLVAIPVRTVVVAVMILAGALYLAAEARYAVSQRRQVELSRMENSIAAPQPSVPAQDKILAGPASPAPAIPQQVAPASAQSDELAAEQQASQLPAQKPAVKTDGHTRQIIISIADRRLALLEDGQLIKTYPIAVGARGTPSPEGEFRVINHAQHPTYRHEGKEIAPGKDNPLGSRWMGLSLKGYGIHGTNVPSSIGKAASHGCFRMAKADVEDLYSRVQVGAAVTIRRQRDELIAKVFEFAPAPAANNATLATKANNNSDVQVASVTSTTPAVEAEQ